MSEDLKYTFVAVGEGGDLNLVKESNLKDYYDVVENGDTEVLRILAFSDEAKAISGKECRVEQMIAESSVEEDEDGKEETKWDISWEVIK